MKIRNVVISEGQDRGYVFSNKSKSIRDMNKFPGAKVLNPKTGLYNPKLTLRERIEKHSEFIKRFGYDFNEPYSLREIPYMELLRKKMSLLTQI